MDAQVKQIWRVHSPKISTAGEEKIAQARLQCLSLFASLGTVTDADVVDDDNDDTYDDDDDDVTVIALRQRPLNS